MDKMQDAYLQIPYSGATTAVVIGESTMREADLLPFRAVLWLTQTESDPALHVPRGTSLEVVRTDRLNPAMLEQAIDRFVARNPRRMPSLFIATDAMAEKHASYQPLIREVRLALEAHHRARFTRQQDGFLWQQHLLTNMRAYLASRFPSTWAGRLGGYPAVVCGAGPSLDVSATALAGISDRAVVLAADSALRTLARHGVRADFAVSIDVAKTPEKCLPEEGAWTPDRTILSAISPPAWSERADAGKRYFLSGRQITLDWLASLGVAGTPVAAVENCGATALQLARFLGCEPIYLFGMDLALDAREPSRRNTKDADGGLYVNSGFNASLRMPTVPGNYSAVVPTHVIGDWRALDARLADWPPGLVHNVNDRGARLRNTVLVKPDNFRLDVAVPDEPKVTALRALDETSVDRNDSLLQAALQALRRSAALGRERLPSIRKALAQGGPEKAVGHLRLLLVDEGFGRAMGAFALKLMPHLVPPIEGDIAFWTKLIDECEELSELAGAG
ncbi:DUF115 domain-containing protein [Termitidicoccus mucosus]|uniref:6-hydroxymethylpterin diphosphokinase MptE-like domain-containing protein n=1 Tax=Termitidicoccus mucosus TaxID=1184151 RepID=A0A178IFV8_9BACT|nr:hypothetical protein AW736_16210 [Opitutaceae bacterium TSB47]